MTPTRAELLEMCDVQLDEPSEWPSHPIARALKSRILSPAIEPRVWFEDDQLCLQWRSKGVLIGISGDGLAWISTKDSSGYGMGWTTINNVTLQDIAECITASQATETVTREEMVNVIAERSSDGRTQAGVIADALRSQFHIIKLYTPEDAT